MTLRIQTMSFDSNDPSAIAAFWEQALGWRRTDEDDDEVAIEPPAGSPEDGVVELLFCKVPEVKQIKNRLHLDLRPDDQAAEVARLEGLGAERVSIGQGDDVTWIVLADPDGNEFCVLRSLTPEGQAEGS